MQLQKEGIILDNINNYLGSELFVIYNEDNFLTTYIGVLESYDHSSIKLLIKNQYHDILVFYDKAVKKIFHIYNDSLFDILNNRYELPLSKCVHSLTTAEAVISIFKKNFKKKLAVIRYNNGGVSIVRGTLFEIGKESIKLQINYYEKITILYNELLHIYDDKFKELLNLDFEI